MGDTRDATGRVVLVVDGDPDAAQAVRRALRSAGYASQVATGVLHAARVAAAGRVDVLVADLDLGDASGLDLIAWVLRRAPRTGVVATTDHASPQLVAQALHLGARSVLAKPFTAGALARAVWGALPVG